MPEIRPVNLRIANVVRCDNRDPMTTELLLRSGELVTMDVAYLLYLVQNALENAERWTPELAEAAGLLYLALKGETR